MQEVYNYDAFIASRSKSPEIIKTLKRGNFILRQELRAYNPECSPKFGIVLISILMVIFFVFGVPIVFLTTNTIEYKIPYTDCSVSGSNKICNINLPINVTIPAPVYLYYELDNFYLNHRDLVKSKSWSQLRGQVNIVFNYIK